MSEPLAYLITFRTYGTWLHGDERGWVDRDHNTYATPMRQANPALLRKEISALKHSPTMLSASQRSAVADSIRQTCEDRDWSLLAMNVRENHAHAVVAAPEMPEKVMHALKSRATRRLREKGLVTAERKLWSRHGSTKYLWKPHQVEAACRYVTDAQGKDLGGQF